MGSGFSLWLTLRFLQNHVLPCFFLLTSSLSIFGTLEMCLLFSRSIVSRTLRLNRRWSFVYTNFPELHTFIHFTCSPFLFSVHSISSFSSCPNYVLDKKNVMPITYNMSLNNQYLLYLHFIDMSLYTLMLITLRIYTIRIILLTVILQNQSQTVTKTALKHVIISCA